MGRYFGLKEVGAWLVALSMILFFIAMVGFRTRDPDSSLHVAISVRLAQEPMARWIAPEWWSDHWSAAGLYREHPAGVFWPPALLARLGYPPRQAAYAVNTLYLACTIILIQRLAALFVGGLEARTLSWLLQLIPIAFTYRLRANHEQIVLLCFLAALYGTERSRARAVWGLLTACAFVGLMYVKGILVVFPPIACAVLLLTDRKGPGMRRAWTMLIVAIAVMFAAAVLYEAAFRSMTGEGFIGPYLGRQLKTAAAPHGAAFIPRKTENLVWYAARVLWFSFPWSLVLIALGWRERKRVWTGRADPSNGTRRAGITCLVMTLLYVLVFSLSDRKADRYIFPAYFLVAACGAVMALRHSARFRRLAERFDSRQPRTTVDVFFIMIGLHLIGGWLHLPRVKIWPSD
ncbi:MAG: glycosyltransferase family 39 protein [Vicinamibacteria bacterium]|nr:glycosyltransferase family 39 protein [Vicinamibacteria bacterium]